MNNILLETLLLISTITFTVFAVFSIINYTKKLKQTNSIREKVNYVSVIILTFVGVISYLYVTISLIM